MARVLAEQMSQEIGQRVFVENRAGASGNIVTQAAASAEADGYTYVIGATPLAINHSLFPDFPVKFGADIRAVASIGASTNALVINPGLNLSSLADFIRFVRARPPESVSYVTLGKGSSSHLAGIEFDRLAGTKLLPVAYRGNGEALQDNIAGHIVAWFAPVPSVGELIRTGKLVGLGVTGLTRAPDLPTVPTLDESGLKGFDVRLWVGLFSRTGIPADRQRVFDLALGRTMGSHVYKTALTTQGIEPLEMARAEFNDFLSSEISRRKPVVEKLP